jgi:hypothetical protein
VLEVRRFELQTYRQTDSVDFDRLQVNQKTNKMNPLSPLSFDDFLRTPRTAGDTECEFTISDRLLARPLMPFPTTNLSRLLLQHLDRSAYAAGYGPGPPDDLSRLWSIQLAFRMGIAHVTVSFEYRDYDLQRQGLSSTNSFGASTPLSQRRVSRIPPPLAL